MDHYNYHHYPLRPEQCEQKPNFISKTNKEGQLQGLSVIPIKEQLPLVVQEKFSRKNEEIDHPPAQKKFHRSMEDEHAELTTSFQPPPMAPSSEATDSQEETKEYLEINEMTNVEFTEILKTPFGKSSDRLQSFLSMLTDETPDDANEATKVRSLWIKTPKVAQPQNEEEDHHWIDLYVNQRTFDSQFQATPSRSMSQKYYFINACVHPGTRDNYYFQIRFDRDLRIAEIMTINAMEGLTGKTVKNLCMSVLDFLKPAKIVLSDDATTTDESKMKMRVFLPVASEAPRTWYSDDGFQPSEFEKMRGANQTTLLGQNKADYEAAVAKVRGASLRILSLDDARDQHQIHQWTKTYLQTDAEVSVHQLAHKMYQALTGRIAEMSKTDQAQAKRDFADFYRKYLVSTSEKIAHLPEYKKALETLENYMIWSRPHK